MFEKVRAIIVDQLAPMVTEDEVTMESSPMQNLGADSLDLVEIVMGVEEEFDIELDADDENNLTLGATVGQLVELVCKKKDIAA